MNSVNLALQQQVNDLTEKLLDQKKNIIEPLIDELKVSEHINKKLRNMHERNVKTLKELIAVLRIPNMA